MPFIHSAIFALFFALTLVYFWILARDKSLSVEVREQLLRQAWTLGFATDKLIWIGQQRTDTN
ncbi:MAG: hypothetical protein ACOH2B_02075 [Burkholderiaceae bacterium]